MSDLVTVPLDLLKAVLDTAESNSYSTQAEFSCSAADDEKYAAERAQIDELRKVAEVTSGGVVGQGFFGVAIALKEQQEKS